MGLLKALLPGSPFMAPLTVFQVFPDATRCRHLEVRACYILRDPEISWDLERPQPRANSQHIFILRDTMVSGPITEGTPPCTIEGPGTLISNYRARRNVDSFTIIHYALPYFFSISNERALGDFFNSLENFKIRKTAPFERFWFLGYFQHKSSFSGGKKERKVHNS